MICIEYSSIFANPPGSWRAPVCNFTLYSCNIRGSGKTCPIIPAQAELSCSIWWWSTLDRAIARDAWSLRGRGTRGFLGTRGNASVCSGSMKRFVTILAALALALVLLAPSDVQARQHASSARSSVGSTGSHVGHRHSDAFLGFMDKHGKNYCGETHPNACETSMLR